MKETFIIFSFLLFTNVFLFGQTHTIFGNIYNLENGESLIGATILAEDRKAGTFSNNFGFYSITLPEGEHIISYSFIGYKPISLQIKLTKDSVLNQGLIPEYKPLDEVIVKSNKNSNIFITQMGSHTLNLSTIKLLPTTLGETDPMKNLQLLPGIQAANEGTANLSVRGGSLDQNLFLLDDAIVYNPSHALGFFSTFNPIAISSLKIYKTSFPAQYGGRLSSILDIRMKEGNNQNINCNIGAGLIASHLSVEGPIKKDKASFIVSGRYSYAGVMVNTLGSLGQSLGIDNLADFNNKNEINFYDFNAKANYKIKNNHFYFSVYSGRDHFYYFSIVNDASIDWGNQTATLRWNHVFNSRLFSNTIIAFSGYDYSYILKDDARNFKWSSKLQELDFKSDYDFFINPANHLKFGIALENHKYFPGKIEPRDTTSLTQAFELESQKALENSIYLSNEQKIGNNISISYGLRYSMFLLLGENTVYSFSSDMKIVDSTHYANGQIIQFYDGLEPRFNLRYLFNKNNSLKISYTYVKQYQHLVSNSSVGLPTDIWLPANKIIKPQYSDQYSIGYYTSLLNGTYEAYSELYFRKIGKVIDYKDNADLFLNPYIETQVLNGKGKAYGVEIYLEKKSGRLTGWISYTLSKTTKQINGINNSKPYPTNYDKRHNIAIVTIYKLSTQWDFASTFKLTSGGYTTIPEGSFNYYGASFNYYTNRNGYKIPTYHRLDISFTYKNSKKQLNKWKPEWNFGIYNVYGHKNIFSLFIKQVDGDFGATQAYKMYLFGITPYFTYNIRF